MPAVYIARNLCKFQSNFPGDGENRVYILCTILCDNIYIIYRYVVSARWRVHARFTIFFSKFYPTSLNCNEFKCIQRFVQYEYMKRICIKLYNTPLRRYLFFFSYTIELQICSYSIQV